MKTITLGGFGDFSEDEAGLKDMQEAAKKHGLEFYPTYYDHELKGDRDAVEALTQDLWGMPRDQWGENNLTETVLTRKYNITFDDGREVIVDASEENAALGEAYVLLRSQGVDTEPLEALSIKPA